MNKEQFGKLKMGDIVEYNCDDVLTGCQFKITKVGGWLAEGTVVKEGSGSISYSYKNGRGISASPEYLTLISGESEAPKSFAVLELNVQEAAVMMSLIRKVGGCPNTSVRKVVDAVHNKLASKFSSDSIFDNEDMFSYATAYNAIALTSLENLDNLLIKKGLLKAPEKPAAPARHKLKGPDGKWVPKNYRVIIYPEHGTGKPVKRHVLWGEFVKGTAGTNVHVEEWCADSKKWCPKTYSLAKVGVVE